MKDYRPEIDGLRALAVIPVILFHAGLAGFAGGFVGVDVFFVISGYLITRIIVDERLAGRFSIIDFYERRARRILPALFLVTLCCLPFAWFWMRPDQLNDFAQSVVAIPVFASNILFFLESGYFDLGVDQKPLLHTWSLAVEEQYYLFFPVLVGLVMAGHAYLTRRRASSQSATATVVAAETANSTTPPPRADAAIRVLGIWLGVIAVLSFLLAEWGWRNAPEANFYLVPFRVWELLIGAFVALHLIRGDLRSAPAATDRSGHAMLALLGLAMLLYAIVAFDERTPFPSVWALLPTLGTALLILHARPTNPVGRLLALPVLVGIGLISYSTYLWHQPLLVFSRLGSLEELTPLQLLVPAVLALPLAWLSWRFVERPFRRKQTISRSTLWVSTVIGALLVGGSGVFLLRGGKIESLNESLALVPAGQVRQVNMERFRLLPNSFESATPGQKKLLLLGDSYMADFVNIYTEAGVFGDQAVAAWYIPADCQTYFGPEDVNSARPLSQIKRCEEEVNEERIEALAHEADTVMLISRWEAWAAERVGDTLTTLGTDTNRVMVIGRKHFYLPNRRQIEAGIGKQRTPESVIAHNARLARQVPASDFIDIQRVVCRRTWPFARYSLMKVR